MTNPTTVSRRDTEPLTGKAVAALHASLRQELAAQEAYVADLEATANELSSELDGGSVLTREVAERAVERGLETIGDIQHALRRLDDGSYGRCERCHDAIDVDRLEAIPHARHCVSCSGRAPQVIG